MGEIQNFQARDWFNEPFGSDNDEDGNAIMPGVEVHIRIQQRSSRKAITSVTGLPDDLDLKRIAKTLRKRCKCSCSAKQHKDWGQVILLQGDHRLAVREFLVKHDICMKEQVILHGY